MLVVVVRRSRSRKKRRLVYLMDEYMGESFERTAINCIPFECMLLVGVSAYVKFMRPMWEKELLAQLLRLCSVI